VGTGVSVGNGVAVGAISPAAVGSGGGAVGNPGASVGVGSRVASTATAGGSVSPSVQAASAKRIRRK